MICNYCGVDIVLTGFTYWQAHTTKYKCENSPTGLHAPEPSSAPASPEHSEQCACEDCTARKRLITATWEPVKAVKSQDNYTNDFGDPPDPEAETPRPEMPPKCAECGKVKDHPNHWAPFGWHNFESEAEY